jgi:putative tricarboxylic transport membrane protein
MSKAVAGKSGRALAVLLAGAIGLGVGASAASAGWEPTKPVEIVATAGPGGGTDTFARLVQSIIAKYKLMPQPVVVVNKGGGSGAEGFAYGKSQVGDPHKLTFATNNEYLLPLVAKFNFKAGDLTPVAAMVLDEFILWVPAKSEYKDAPGYLTAAKAKPETFKMGGAQSKDTDETLTKMIEAVSGAKFIYIPFKSGGEAAVQLAGGHQDSNTNNPSENIGQWKADLVRPLCVFSTARMPAGPKVTATMSWADIPTCKEQGIAIDKFQMPRTVWLPTGVPADAIDYYVGVLKKVRETPEWKEYTERTSQTDRFLVGADFKAFIADDETATRKVFEAQGWIAK